MIDDLRGDLISQTVVTYQYELMEVVGFRTSGKLYRESLTDGTYLNHLATLIEDKLVKSTDRQRLKGYLLKWREARMLIGGGKLG